MGWLPSCASWRALPPLWQAGRPLPHALSRSGRRRAGAQPALRELLLCTLCTLRSLLLGQQVLQVGAHRIQAGGAAQLLVNHRI